MLFLILWFVLMLIILQIRQGIVLNAITSELREARRKAVFDRVEELKSCKSELFDEIFRKDVANKK